jgi:hypothetical protein
MPNFVRRLNRKSGPSQTNFALSSPNHKIFVSKSRQPVTAGAPSHAPPAPQGELSAG